MDWFRCYSEFATDSKVQIMSEYMQRRLIMLFCLRSSNALATLHETEIAFSLRISEQELQETKALFIQKGFINETWEILNWDKRQYVSDSSTERSRKHRERKKELLQQQCNVAATPPDQIRSESEQIDKSSHHPTATRARVATSVPIDDDFRKKNFDVDFYLDDDDRRMENVLAPNWDKDLLHRDFNEWIKKPGQKIPQKPAKAYLGWLEKTKKGKPPP